MFPEPLDLGIAQADQAVSSVRYGTESYLTGGRGGARPGTRAAARVGDRAVQGITVYPPTRGVQTQGDPFEPVKIGVLIDMDLGQLLADWIDPTMLALEDAERGRVAAARSSWWWPTPGACPRELPQRC
jgi:hypothetical protein